MAVSGLLRAFGEADGERRQDIGVCTPRTGLLVQQALRIAAWMAVYALTNSGTPATNHSSKLCSLH